MDLRSALAVLACLSAVAPPVVAAPSLHVDDDPRSPHYGTVAAGPLADEIRSGLAGRKVTPEAWREVLAVYTGEDLPTDGRPAVAGSWAVEKNVLRFRPRYPLRAGLDFVARFDLSRLHSMASGHTGGADGEVLVARFALPKEEVAPSTVVTAIYPTASELPENQLRLYVHFSAPMSRGEAYGHIRLLDASGQPAEAPFLEITEELWDPGMRRLTLFFDPGRIKRGLRPHLEAGPPLREGGSYRLEIDPGWLDARGVPLAAGFHKDFSVTAPDRQAPDPADWEITAPPAGSLDALELRFPEPLDHALLERVVRVRSGSEDLVPGRAEVRDQERVLRWLPETPWPAGEYAIDVAAILEDLAGNNLSKVFDVEMTGEGSATPGGQTPDRDRVSIPFHVQEP